MSFLHLLIICCSNLIIKTTIHLAVFLFDTVHKTFLAKKKQRFLLAKEEIFFKNKISKLLTILVSWSNINNS